MNNIAIDPISLAGTIIVLLAIIYLVVTVAIHIKKIREGEVGLVERLGKYTHTLKPGTHFLVPYIDRIAWVVSTVPFTREFVVPDLTTADGEPLQDAIVTVTSQVTDAAESTYGDHAKNYEESPDYVDATFRELVATRTSDEILSVPLAVVAGEFKEALDAQLNPAGVNIHSVQVSPFRRA